MIKKFYQQIRKNRWVLDFHKLAEEPVNVWVIISAREREGKTLNVLQYVRDRYLSHNHQAVLCFNTEDMWPTGAKLMSANQELYPKKWENVIHTSKGLYDTKTKEIFLYFATVSTAHKMKPGNRQPRVRTLIYDEFNEGTFSIGERQHERFDNLLKSVFTMYAEQKVVDSYRVFILGNNLTAASPLLTQWQIYELPKNELELYENHLPIMVFNPRAPIVDNKSEYDTKRNWLMGISKLNDTFENSIIGNQFLDNMDNVIPRKNHIFYKVSTKKRLLKVSENYFLQSWKSAKGETFFSLVKRKDKPKNPHSVKCINRKQIEVGVKYDKFIKEAVLQQLSQSKIFFDSSVSKILLRKNL